MSVYLNLTHALDCLAIMARCLNSNKQNIKKLRISFYLKFNPEGVLSHPVEARLFTFALSIALKDAGAHSLKQSTIYITNVRHGSSLCKGESANKLDNE